jgi:WD repeat-containing protein 23
LFLAGLIVNFYVDIAASSWNGWGMDYGTCTTHIWNDDIEGAEAGPRVGTRVNERLEHEERLYSRPGHTRAGAESYVGDDSDDDW